MNTELTRAKEAAAASLLTFDRAGTDTVLQTVPALAQTLRELLAAVTAPNPPADYAREAFDLDALEATARAATPGPWTAMTTGVAGGDHWYIVDDGEVVAYISANDGGDEDQRESNARHVAGASPDVMLALIERLRAAEVRPRGTVTDAGSAS